MREDDGREDRGETFSLTVLVFLLAQPATTTVWVRESKDKGKSERERGIRYTGMGRVPRSLEDQSDTYQSEEENIGYERFLRLWGSGTRKSLSGVEFNRQKYFPYQRKNF